MKFGMRNRKIIEERNDYYKEMEEKMKNIYKGLRREEELEYWMNRCPIKMLEELLLKHGIISEPEIIRIRESIEDEVEETLVFAKGSPYPNPNENKFISGVFKDIDQG